MRTLLTSALLVVLAVAAFAQQPAPAPPLPQQARHATPADAELAEEQPQHLLQRAHTL